MHKSQHISNYFKWKFTKYSNKKQNLFEQTFYMPLIKAHLNYNNLEKLKVNWWKNIYCANLARKKADVAILISDKVYKAKSIIKYYNIVYIYNNIYNVKSQLNKKIKNPKVICP